MQKKEFVLIEVPSAQGCLGKNMGTELFPARLRAFFQKNYPKNKLFCAEVIQSDFDSTSKNIEACAFSIFSKKFALPFFIGGDHSITFPIVSAYSRVQKNTVKKAERKYCKKSRKIGLIVFDAHVDCTSDFLAPSHEDIIRSIAKDNLIKPENILLLGIRKIYAIENKFLQNDKIGKEIKLIRASEINNSKKFKKSQMFLHDFIKNLNSVYVSIDIDVFDPKIAPATGYLVKNGLFEKQFFALLDIILKSEKAVGFDLVEVNPKKDLRNRTFLLSKKIIKRILC
ncbi:MAG: arginase family protein [archaeon]